MLAPDNIQFVHVSNVSLQSIVGMSLTYSWCLQYFLTVVHLKSYIFVCVCVITLHVNWWYILLHYKPHLSSFRPEILWYRPHCVGGSLSLQHRQTFPGRTRVFCQVRLCVCVCVYRSIIQKKNASDDSDTIVRKKK